MQDGGEFSDGLTAVLAREGLAAGRGQGERSALDGQRDDIDEFVVGYKDRHSARLMEKPAVQWAKDTTDEEFIPEHRIEYFKRCDKDGKEEVLWDKSLRLDKIFQHGGSG